MFLKLTTDGFVEELETNKFEDLDIKKELNCEDWDRVRLNNHFSLIVDIDGAVNGKLLNEKATAQYAVLQHSRRINGYEIYGDAIVVQEGYEDFQPVDLDLLLFETATGMKWIFPELAFLEDKGENL